MDANTAQDQHIHHQSRCLRLWDSPSSKVGTSRKFFPLGVFVPFFIIPKKASVTLFQPVSPSSHPKIPQNSMRNSLGSFTLSASDFFPIFRPKEDLRLPTPGLCVPFVEAGESREKEENVKREPEGEVPWRVGEGSDGIGGVVKEAWVEARF